jgi:ubiquitin C-terminal hydrolase
MAYVRREDGRWYHFSDTRVRNASEYEAMTSAGAYVLFYQRV